VQPRFDIAQGVYENLSFGELEHGLEEILSSGYSVSLFTDWQQHRVTQAWLKRRVEDGHAPEFPARFHGATLQAEKLHPLAGHSAENCTEQLGVPGPWYERLPHFRMDFTPSSGAELQTEYFVAREHGWAAIQAVEELRDQITPHLMVSELRAVAADALWLSMAYERASLAFHFTWKPDWAVVQHILPQVEAKLAPYGARPHWGKLFAMPGEHVRGLYPKFGEFAALREKYDPDRRFENRFLSRLLA
jgi:xylitol oxidase